MNDKQPTSAATNAYDLLSDIAQIITDEPRRYNQSLWWIKSGGHGQSPLRGFPECGTVACVGGWVEILKGLDSGVSAPRNYSLTHAAQILGLTQSQEAELFSSTAVSPWLFGFFGPRTAAYARRGARHIQRFQAKYAEQLKAKAV